MRGKKPQIINSRPQGTPLIGKRRLWIFRLTAMFLIPLLLLLTMESLLRLAGYGYDPHFFKEMKIEGIPFLVQNDAFSYRFFPREMARYPKAIRMQAVKSPDSIRIFILGESAAMGDPAAAYGPARHMEVLLRARYPDVDFEFVNTAFAAINSHVILPIARECADHRADLWIIYMGNNEMVGPFGASTVFGRQASPLAQIRAALFVQQYRLGQLLHAWTHKLKGGAKDLPGWGGMGMFVNNQVAPNDPKREVIGTNFRRNLEDIIELGAKAKVGILLSTVAVNLKDSPPFASMPDPELSNDEKAQFETLLAGARAVLSDSRPGSAADRYAQAMEIDPAFAAAQYEWGSALLFQTNSIAAKAAFQRACDSDALCFRTDSRLNEIIRITAEANLMCGVRLVNAELELEAFADVSILGSETFYEHVHFNFDGAYGMGLTWAQAAEEMLAHRLTPPRRKNWASQSACDALLGLTVWNRILVLESMIKRLQEAPLNSQPNNSIRTRLLEEKVEHLRKTTDKDAIEEAREIFNAALAVTPIEPLLLGEQAKFLEAVGDLESAVEVWKKVGELTPNDSTPLFQLGLLERLRGNEEEAEQYLRRALEIRPTRLQGWIELALLFERQQRWEAALQAMQRAAALQPQDPHPWARQAQMLTVMGRNLQAIEFYLEAIRIRPDYWEAHMALGDLYALQGSVTEAVAQYRETLRIKPDHVPAHVNLGTLLVKLGQLNEAMEHYETAIRIDPDSRAAREYLKRTKDYVDQLR